MNDRYADKIFGIGLARTGTGSLVAALRCLGYRCNHWIYSNPKGLLRQLLNADFDLEGLRDVDAWVETPINMLYPQLDQRCPGSRFILTVRDVDKWLASVERRFSNDVNYYGQQMRFLVFGCARFDQQRMRHVYDQHLANVHEYFKQRSGDLLVFNVDRGDGWAELCGFLNRPIPDEPYPVTNNADSRNRGLNVARRIKRLYQRVAA
ncbi:MAG: sulfotransferase family protein [Pirellulales bacterium]